MRLLISFLLLISMASMLVAQEATPQNCQFFTVVQVDGRGDEWPVKWLEDDDQEFFYNICTDESRIYIRMKVKGELLRRKIALFGFTVWLDPNGKKKKKLGLRFPTGREAEEVMEKFRLSGDHSTMTLKEQTDFQKQMEKELIGNLEILELMGLADDPLTSTRSGITNGIKVAIAQDDEGSYVYEAIIPFKSYRLSKASISVLGVGFETGRYTVSKDNVKGGSNAGSTAAPAVPGQPGSGRNPNAIDMARGQGYSSSEGGSQMSYSTSLWVPINFKK